MMNRAELEQFLVANGWEKDAHGHYHKGERRMKMQATSVRYEKSYRTSDTEYSKGEKRWVNLCSGYYKRLSIVDGKISGLKRQH